MVDGTRVYRLLSQVTARLARLRALGLPGAGSTEERTVEVDPIRLDAAKYLLITAVEACVDVAQHLVASEGWGAPASNADAFRLLASAGVLPDAADMVAAVGLRNVLVHGYAEVDDALVVAAAGDPSRLSAFVADVSRWVGPDTG